jgi:HSP20 family molecular chaperone IbpA
MQKTIIKEEEQVINDFLFSEVWNPAADVYETEEEIMIILELAGVKAQDIHYIINKDNVMHIWGKRENPLPRPRRNGISALPQQGGEEIAGKYHLTGVHFGTFSKYIPLPVKVVKKETELQNMNGIFKLAFKKIPAKA